MSHKFAVFDIDGTVARTSLYLAMVHALMRRGIINKAGAARIETALEHWLSRSDDQAFETYGDVCVEVLNEALPSIKVSAYEEAVEEVLSRFGHKTYRYPIRLIKELKEQGYKIFAVSGSEERLVKAFCERYGFDDFIGNSYGHDGIYFTGERGSTYRDKQQYVEQLMTKHGCVKEGSIAMGDSHGDIEMLAFVDRAIAFNPNQELYKHAQEQGWEIVVERKNVVYNLQAGKHGYLLA